jgi:hypothetical protein
VIDVGRVKEMQFDAMNRRSSLKEMWISQAAADQRKGNEPLYIYIEIYPAHGMGYFGKQ